MRNDVTRFPFGIATAQVGAPLAAYGLPDPTGWHSWFDDFDDYLAADWVVTATGTQAPVGGDGGLLLLTNGAADNDITALQWAGGLGSVLTSFHFDPAKRLFIEGRMSVSDAVQSDIALGLYVADASPIDSVPTSGIYLLKADGAATFVARVGAASAYAVSSAVGAIANNTFFTWAMSYEGIPRTDQAGALHYDFNVFFNGSQVGGVDALAANIPVAGTGMSVSVAVQNGEAVAKTLTVDRILVAKER